MNARRNSQAVFSAGVVTGRAEIEVFSLPARSLRLCQGVTTLSGLLFCPCRSLSGGSVAATPSVAGGSERIKAWIGLLVQAGPNKEMSSSAAGRNWSPLAIKGTRLRSLSLHHSENGIENRVAPAGNAPASRRRVIRADNHGGWMQQPGRLIQAVAPLWRNYHGNSESCQRMARGLRLVACEPRDSKKRRAKELKNDPFRRSKLTSRGFTAYNRLRI